MHWAWEGKPKVSQEVYFPFSSTTLFLLILFSLLPLLSYTLRPPILVSLLLSLFSSLTVKCSFLVWVTWIPLVSRQTAEKFIETLHWLQTHRHPIDTRITKSKFGSVTVHMEKRLGLNFHTSSIQVFCWSFAVCLPRATVTSGIRLTYCVQCYTCLKSSFICTRLINSVLGNIISCFIAFFNLFNGAQFKPCFQSKEGITLTTCWGRSAQSALMPPYGMDGRDIYDL